MSRQGKQVSADDGGETLKLQDWTLKDDFAGVDIAALDTSSPAISVKPTAAAGKRRQVGRF